MLTRLGIGNTNNNTYLKGTPFFNYLTKDGDGTTRDLNGQANSNYYWQTPGNCLIQTITFSGGSGGFSASRKLCSNFLLSSGNNPLSQGLKLSIQNSSGTVLQDITYSGNGLTTNTDLNLVSAQTPDGFLDMIGGSPSSEAMLIFILRFEDKFGANVQMKAGQRLLAREQTSIVNSFVIAVSGVYT